jgi:hypothetical protein
MLTILVCFYFSLSTACGMSLESVFKNLYKFFEILKESTSEHVSCWNKQSINNAFHWALYAEQVVFFFVFVIYRVQIRRDIRLIKKHNY